MGDRGATGLRGGRHIDIAIVGHTQSADAAARTLAIEVTYTRLDRQSPGRDDASPGRVCDSITTKFRSVDVAPQPPRRAGTRVIPILGASAARGVDDAVVRRPQVLPAWLEWVVRDGDNPLDGQPPERDR